MDNAELILTHMFSNLKSIQILKARVIKQLLIKSSSNMLRNTKIIHKYYAYEYGKHTKVAL